MARRTFSYIEDHYAAPGFYSDQHADEDQGVNLMPTVDADGGFVPGFLFHDAVEHLGDSGEGDSATELQAVGSAMILRSWVFATADHETTILSILDEQGVPQGTPPAGPVSDQWSILADNTQYASLDVDRVRARILSVVEEAAGMAEDERADLLEEGDAYEQGVLLAACDSLRDGETVDEIADEITRAALSWVQSAPAGLSALYPKNEAPMVEDVESPVRDLLDEAEEILGSVSAVGWFCIDLGPDGSVVVTSGLDEARAEWEALEEEEDEADA